MPLFWLVIAVCVIAAVGYVLGRQKALASAGGESRGLHSLPSYYGSNVALKAAVPAFILLLIWLLVQPLYIGSSVSGTLPDSAIPEGQNRNLVMAEVRRVAIGISNAVDQNTLDQTAARDPQANVDDVTQGLKDAGQIVTHAITPPVLNAAQKLRAIGGHGGILEDSPQQCQR